MNANKIVRRVLSMRTNEAARAFILDTLRQLSREQGGAWVCLLPPFCQSGDTALFERFASPSRVPDRYLELVAPGDEDAKIGWKGDMVPFTFAARIREQNRGLTCE